MASTSLIDFCLSSNLADCEIRITDVFEEKFNSLDSAQ